MEETPGIIESTFISQLLTLILLFAILTAMMYGLRFVYIGIKNNKKWAKITAIVVAVVFVLAILGGIGFYLFAAAF